MAVADKAVSTEDLIVPHNTCLEVAKLEAVLNTLVENKVEAIKNESLHNSPKTLINRLRITSTSTASSKDKEEASEHNFHNGKHRKRKERYIVRSGRSRPRKSTSSTPESSKFSPAKCCERTPPLSEDEGQEALDFLKYEVCNRDICLANEHNAHACCCNTNRNGQIKMTFDEDYISLKIEELDEDEEEEAMRRARRKRRRRKRRRMKRLALASMPVEEVVKVIDPDELPQRARWTIVATACLLLFMCLLLVGVTLRMAPIIDDMVRKENEELMQSLHREHSHHSSHNSTSPVPF